MVQKKKHIYLSIIREVIEKMFIKLLLSVKGFILLLFFDPTALFLLVKLCWQKPYHSNSTLWGDSDNYMEEFKPFQDILGFPLDSSAF